MKGGGVKFYWLGAGTTDQARERTVNLSELVKKDGFNTTYREIPGRHYWFLWRDFLAHYAQIAFQPAGEVVNVGVLVAICRFDRKRNDQPYLRDLEP